MNDKENIEQLLNLHHAMSIVEKAEMREQLVVYVNHLLLHDFNKLVQILYRVDVSEKKLKELLQQSPQTDAAVIIAGLLIERQQEKIKTKESFKTNNDIAEEDKW